MKLFPFTRFQISDDGTVSVTLCATPGVFPCIDFERKQRYDLTVRAEDNLRNQGFLASTQPLTIYITDVNDNRPVFVNLRYVRSIREGDTITTDPLLINVSLVISLIYLMNYVSITCTVKIADMAGCFRWQAAKMTVFSNHQIFSLLSVPY